MATEVVLPKLGLTQEEGTIVRWIKTEGSRVSKGEPLFEVLTDKAAIEVEAPASGVLLRILVPEGATAPVAAPIAVIGEPGERVGVASSVAGPPGPAPPGPAPPAAPSAGIAANAFAAVPSTAPAIASAAPAGDAGAGVASGDAGASRRAGRRISPAGPPGGLVPEGGDGRIRVSPRARALAEANGVDIRALRGSGPDGRIIERDVQQVIAAAPRAAAASPASAPSPTAAVPRAPTAAPSGGPTAGAPAAASPPSGASRLLLHGCGPQVGPQDAPASPVSAHLRAVIARRMTESLQTTAQLTLTTEADMAEAARLRDEAGAELERREGVRPTFTDLVVRAAAIALRDHPRLNARWDESGVRRLPEIHIGVAVALDEGLMVPVIRHTDRLTLAQISAAVRDLSERARGFRIRPGEMEGGTFTVTNLGMYEIDAFTPILNPPEAAILGVGRVHRRPIAVAAPSPEGPISPAGGDRSGGHDRVEVRPVMALSLTFDHRVVDGAPAAQFLQRVKHVLEHPYLLLLP